MTKKPASDNPPVNNNFPSPDFDNQSPGSLRAELLNRKYELKLLKASVEQTQTALVDCLTSQLRQTPPDKVQDVASKLYWTHQRMVSPVKSAYRKTFRREFSPDPKQLDTECLYCGGTYTAWCKTWNDLA